MDPGIYLPIDCKWLSGEILTPVAGYVLFFSAKPVQVGCCWSAGFSFIGQGMRYDDTANTDELSGYGIINLRASYAVSKKLSIKWKIENLLDKKYETAKDYNNPGINGYLSLVYQGF